MGAVIAHIPYEAPTSINFIEIKGSVSLEVRRIPHIESIGAAIRELAVVCYTEAYVPSMEPNTLVILELRI